MARLAKARDNIQNIMRENDKMLAMIAQQLEEINNTIKETNNILRKVLK